MYSVYCGNGISLWSLHWLVNGGAKQMKEDSLEEYLFNSMVKFEIKKIKFLTHNWGYSSTENSMPTLNRNELILPKSVL